MWKGGSFSGMERGELVYTQKSRNSNRFVLNTKTARDLLSAKSFPNRYPSMPDLEKKQSLFSRTLEPTKPQCSQFTIPKIQWRIPVNRFSLKWENQNFLHTVQHSRKLPLSLPKRLRAGPLTISRWLALLRTSINRAIAPHTMDSSFFAEYPLS